ncbi:hypothetical protein [Aquimarina sp. MMG016]|uniref:hypothetical protein n=1 Tax=Aquimarina sp. MMG016 TaxID=2822690 RepID=UPI001B3A6E29|nr:hypothetical protein [Aquimarina sp. MMG016]MBQ4822369.1 hypothetical protein [Aquimarina sp. MMG016]
MKASIIFILALLMGNIGFSNEVEGSIVLLSSKNKKVVLAYHGFENVKTKVIIEDTNNKTLYREKAKTPDVLQNQFSLTNLEGNTFLVTLENEYKVVQTIFKFVQGKAEKVETPLEVFKPVFKKKGSIVLLYIPNPLEKEVSITITDKKGVNLIPTIRSSKVMIKKKIDFSKYSTKAVIQVDNGKRFLGSFKF